MVTTTRGGEVCEASVAAHIIAFDDAMEQYDGQWLLLGVEEIDAHHLPAAVQVVAVGPDEAAVCRAFADLTPSSEKPVHGYYLTEAYRHIRDGEEAHRELADAVG